MQCAGMLCRQAATELWDKQWALRFVVGVD